MNQEEYGNIIKTVSITLTLRHQRMLDEMEAQTGKKNQISSLCREAIEKLYAEKFPQPAPAPSGEKEG